MIRPHRRSRRARVPRIAPFGIKAINVNNTAMVVGHGTPCRTRPCTIRCISPERASWTSLAPDGTMLRRITSDSHLNAPWGALIPPASFGSFGASGDLLVGNFGDGTINAYNLRHWRLYRPDERSERHGHRECFPMGHGFRWRRASATPNTMYITAGLANEQHGLFSAITANATPAPTSDFKHQRITIDLDDQCGANPLSFTVTLGGLNGFNSAVALTCSGQPANSTCSFSACVRHPFQRWNGDVHDDDQHFLLAL